MDNSVEEAEELKVQRQRKVPKSIPFILINIFLERYSYTGTSAILALYLNRKLNFNPDQSTALFHAYELIAYIFPIIGAIIADSWWGPFKTILWMLLAFAVGNSIVTVGAFEFLNLPTLTFAFTGLIIGVIGSGCMRANITAFGGNQYKLPEQASQLSLLFFLQILATRLGALSGRFVVPILKQDVKCFGVDDCYSLAFGSTAVAMAIAFCVFWLGKSFYVHQPPSGNMLVKVSKCVVSGISEKLKSQSKSSKDHWLDHAEEKHGSKLVKETKSVLNILVLYLPLPIYWAVYQLQGSRWIFQATRMNGDLGFYNVKPDQIIVLSPIFGMFALPMCDYVIFPLLTKIGIKTFLQRMTVGGMLLVVASVIAALIEIKIQNEFVTIFWLAPQYLVASFSENFVYNSHLSFAFNEAPASMKSVMTSFVFVTIGIGNVFVIIVSGARLFESQAVEYFFYSGVLLVFMILFGLLASAYKPFNPTVIKSSTDKAAADRV